MCISKKKLYFCVDRFFCFVIFWSQVQEFHGWPSHLLPRHLCLWQYMSIPFFFLQKRRPLQSQDHCAKVISMIITIPSFSIVIQKFCSHFYIAWDDKEKQQIYVCKYSVFSQTLLTPICILSAVCVAFTDCICRAVGHAQLRYLSCRGARTVACAQPRKTDGDMQHADVTWKIVRSPP